MVYGSAGAIKNVRVMKVFINDVVIRNMNLADMQTALDWAAAEGWNPGLHDAKAFYYTDPGGFFMATINGRPAGIISAVAYDETYGFIGFFIVRPEYRGNSLAMLLGKKAFDYLGNRTIGLDGVVNRLENYRAFGFEVAHNNTRFAGVAGGKADKRVMALNDIPFNRLLAYDKAVSGFQRQTFLTHWINQPGCYALALPDGSGNLLGYGVIRPCRTGYKIGPLFADGGENALVLFGSLCNCVRGEQVFLDVPEHNQQALQMAGAAGMEPVFSTARMYSHGMPASDNGSVFGITSFELG